MSQDSRITAPMAGRVVAVEAEAGTRLAAGATIVILEAMKMEYLIVAETAGIVTEIMVAPDQILDEGTIVARIRPVESDSSAPTASAQVQGDAIRADLADVAIAAQRRRRQLDDLIRTTPADGMIAGIGTINAAEFGSEKTRSLILAYDFTVLAGTQGAMNHKKKDRMLSLAQDWRLPVVLFAEGGGGRPGDSDVLGVAGLDTPSFLKFAQLSGRVPLVGIVSGRCFAGNAALLGCCDVIIATQDANIGMGGPAMIEGGGLGVFAPEEIGPYDVQTRNGVIDIGVADEVEAVARAKQYLGYFQGRLASWAAAVQQELRQAIPENRLRAYDIRRVISLIADKGSVLELRRDFGVGMVTALIRIEGRPMGLIANNPMHLGGAIDADAADKSARFQQLCDVHGLPILSLCDTPGFMVGPEIEKRAQVRHASRLFIVGANLSVPVFAIVLRKGYGLGAQGMTGGSFHAPFFIASWPTGEFGGMGLEGAVRLGYRREMAAMKDEAERQAFFQKMVARSYENGKAINMASFLEIDAVIDPAETRRWILGGLESCALSDRPVRPRFIDSW